MREIILTQGKIALVDDADFDLVSRWNWYAHRDHQYSRFYAMVTIRDGAKQRSLMMHRIILSVTDRLTHVDHINHDGLDNRRDNLRVCTHSQNQANRTKRAGFTSRFKGVHYNRKHRCWYAQVTQLGRKIYTKGFATEEQAVLAYNEAAKKYHGEFAVQNEVTHA